MKKLLGIVVLGLLLTSCAPLPDYDADSGINKWTYDEALAKINSARLLYLQVGMSESQVFGIMGTTNARDINNPHDVSLFASGKDAITVIYYYTNYSNNYLPYYSCKICSHNLKPIILLNGKLIGWGNEALRRVVDRYDLEINID